MALFSPHRTVGLVCDGAQMSLQSLGKDSFFATSIGNAFQVYNCDHLTLALVSRQIPHQISHVASAKETTFGATSVGIVVWNRAQPVQVLQWAAYGDGCAGAVIALECIGDVLCSLHDDGRVRIWNATKAAAPRPPSQQQQGGGLAAADRSDCPIPGVPLAPPDVLLRDVALPQGTNPTCMLHPPSYINKLAVGTASGSILIVNFNSGRVVHECVLDPRNGASAVTCLAFSSEVDVVGAGLLDGRVVVHNLRLDRTVCVLEHSAADGAAVGGSVSSIAFSFDNTLSFPALVSASESGALAVWNLESRSLVLRVLGAHDGAIPFLRFLPRQPCVLSAGRDNALRVWQLDTLGGSMAVLRSRTGHTATPRLLTFYGGTSVASLASGASASVCEVVSSGGADCSVRSFHTGGLDRQNVELSQGPLTSKAKALGVHPNALRLPPVTALAASDRRQGQWADVVTAHAGLSLLHLWSWESKRLEERVCAMPNPQETICAVAISACGHFAVAGGAAGSLVKFNLQSAARRGTFPKDPKGPGKMATKGPKRGPLLAGGALEPPQRDTGKGGVPGGRGVGHLVDSYDAAIARAFGNVNATSTASAAAAAAKRARAAVEEAGAAPAPPPPSHAGASVRGVGIDALNSTLVSCDSRGRVLFWDFASHEYRGALDLPAGAVLLKMHRDSGLAAIACDDFVVRVVDSGTRRLARSFHGHSNRLTDVAFSPDARWLVSASLDSCLRVWDMPSGRCIDWMLFAHVPTAVAFSPTDEVLVTAHVDSPGLALWTNRVHYGSAGASAAASAGTAPTAPVFMDAPRVAGAVGEGEHGGEGPEGGLAHGAEHPHPAAQPSSTVAEGTEEIQPRPDCHLTLSGLPPSAWQNITKLELIARRNKPTLPPTKPAAAPFFLATTGGVHPVFVAPSSSASAAAAAPSTGEKQVAADWSGGAWEDNGEDNEEREVDGAAADGAAGAPAADGKAAGGRLLRSTGTRTARSALAGLLRAAAAAEPATPAAAGEPALPAAQAGAIAAHLASLAPAAVDVEVRALCLGREDHDGMQLLGVLLAFFAAQIASGRRFELVQAHLALTLQVYAELIGCDDALRAAAQRIRELQDAHSARLSAMLDKGLCVLSSLLGL